MASAAPALYLSSVARPRVFEATSSAASNDRGVIHQLLTDVGVGSDTAHAVQVWTVGPLKVLVVLLIALVLTRIERRFSRRLVSTLRVVSPMGPSTRGLERTQTIAGVISAIFRTVIWVIAWLTIFSQLGIRLTPFVAGATVIGAALGFGAQTLVKDFLSGLLIIAEDQYEVGDDIVVGTTSGTVEGVTLRVTRIRSIDGVVWYVPNGDIRTVGNNSESDSVALVEVVVPLGTDLTAAGRVAEEEARKMAEDLDWAACIIGEPNFAGVAAVDAVGVTMRVTVRTTPGDHIRVARNLRLRILERLRIDGLAWAPVPVPTPTTAAPPAPTPQAPTPQAPAPQDATPQAPTPRSTLVDPSRQWRRVAHWRERRRRKRNHGL